MRPLQYRDVTKKQLITRIDALAQIIKARDAQIEGLLAASQRFLAAHVADPSGFCEPTVSQEAFVEFATTIEEVASG